MDMRRQLRDGKRVRLLASSFAKDVTSAHVNRHATLQIRQPKVDAPVPAKGRAQQTEERLVLVDGQELPIAHRPALRRVTETKDSDFREKWFCHDFLLHRVKLKFRVQSLDCYAVGIEL